jgi:phytoene dehydrogenase-like protein
LDAIIDLVPESDRSLSLSQKLDRVFGDNEAVKCALAANLSYYHDDPATLSWVFFAAAQGAYLQSGGCYVQGGSQRLSSALGRAIKVAGGQMLVRRLVSAIAMDPQGRAHQVTHTARDGSDPRIIEAGRIVSNAAPAITAELLKGAASERLTAGYVDQTSSISLFALTLGLSKPPRENGIRGYSTQLLPPWMKRLSEYSQGSTLMAEEPGGRMPPMSIVDYAAIDSGVSAPPYALSIFGPDRLSNWDSSDMDGYREKRGRWEIAIVRYLDSIYPGLAAAVTSSSFNTALSVRQYLNAPDGAVYGFAPTLQPGASVRSPRTPVPDLYLSSAYAGFGGYTGVIAAAGVCADMILRES